MNFSMSHDAATEATVRARQRRRPAAPSAAPRCRVAVAALICAAAGALPGAQAFGEAQKYLLVSSPSSHTIGYLKLPTNGEMANASTLKVLVDNGLSVPQGIATDEYRQKLYVADPDLNKLVGYNLRSSGDALKVGAQFTVASGVEARWVAVDGIGNVYFTDEANNRILKVPASAIEAGTETTPEVLFDGGTNASAVSSPGGVASDSIFVYWLNKAKGTQVGSLIKSLPGGSPQTSVMANNAVKSYGVCIGTSHIFYTNEESYMYAVARNGGGSAQTVSSGLSQPRGCAGDGDGTVYVADKMKNAVYAFAANRKSFDSPASLFKAADFPGAFGLSVYAKVMIS